jgi:hypothetical protein
MENSYDTKSVVSVEIKNIYAVVVIATVLLIEKIYASIQG